MNKTIAFTPSSSPPDAEAALPFTRPRAGAGASRHPGQGAAARPSPPSTGSWALPFQQPSAAGGPPASASPSQPPAAQAGADAEALQRAQRITLAQYVRICARMRDFPAHIDVIQGHYGLDPQSWAALHQLWHGRFQRDPALKARWEALVDEDSQR